MIHHESEKNRPLRLWKGLRIIPGVVLAVFLVGGQVSAAGSTEREATRQTMQAIFDSLRFLLHLDASGQNFDDPKNRTRVLQALRELDDQAAILAAHGFSEDSGGMFLASVLERYSLLMLRSYEHGEREHVQKLLYGITDVCIACHTRLPSPNDSPVARQFIKSKEFASLPPRKKAQIEVATRRFEDALATFETLIESAKTIDASGFEDLLRTYLIINIRVKGDMERPIPMLELVAERSDPHSAWSRDVEIWLESLQALRDQPYSGEPLETAREMLSTADSASYPSRRSALVEYIAASSLLNRYLRSNPPDTKNVSEAHYLLGLAEFRIRPDEWLPHAELYLEVAIVLAPDAKWARPAYELLVEKIDQTYGRSPGGPPPEVVERLRELKEAIDNSRPSNAAAPDASVSWTS